MRQLDIRKSFRFRPTPSNLSTERGAAVIIGVLLIVVLLLGASIFAYLALTQKSTPSLVADQTTVAADDLLAAGSSNGDLVTDYRIIVAGVKRDGDERDTVKGILADTSLPIGDGVSASTTVEAERLSQMQTEYIKEADRRLDILNTTADKAEKLTSDQKTNSVKYIGDEVTALTGLKAKAAAETDKDAFLKDRDDLDDEYVNYLMSISQVYLLLWGNDQQVLAEKANVLGGKMQERLNDASNAGKSIATAQTLLNTYQTSKKTAQDTNEKALKATMAIKPSTFNANKAVLQAHYNELATAHDSLQKTSDDSKDIILAIRAY
jgi:hypothetical protein